jgi:hypothetical protein
MAISLPDTCNLSDEVLAALRLLALRGCEMGSSHADVTQMLGVYSETVSRWWPACTGNGLDALSGEGTGRGVGKYPA